MADNVSLFNQMFELVTRWSPRGQKSYSTVIDYKDALKGNVPEFFKATQKDKPSPVSPWTYNQASSYIRKAFPSGWKIKLAFVGWTNSMEPVLDHGDIAIEVPYEEYKKRFGGLRPGQIAVYRLGNSRIIHRYIGDTLDGKYLFRGDNNIRPDLPVSESQIEDVLIGIFYTKDKVLEGKD